MHCNCIRLLCARAHSVFVLAGAEPLLNELNRMAERCDEALASGETRRPRAGYQPTPGSLKCVDRTTRNARSP